jgi:antibiotic biosynthesis monooxygenase (ABM) superfamily enzyme
MAVLTSVGIWPLVSALLSFCAPHLRTAPFLVRTAVITAAAVAAMTYAVMPALTRLAALWIHPGAPAN